MNELRSVPWTGWQEWDLVRQLLYSTDPQERKLGVKRVSAWTSRGRVPIAVASTANLVEATLKDESSENSFITDTEKRFVYSMSIVRMLNGFVAPFHGDRATPLTVVAKKLGLPSSLVDVRHDSSHSADIPSIFVLRTAAKQALDWLQTTYWEHQKVALQNLDSELQQLLSEYFAEMKSNTSAKTSKKYQEVSPKIIAITKNCSASRVTQSLVPMLLDNFLIPKSSTPKKINSIPERLTKMFYPALNYFSAQWSHFVHYLLIGIAQRVVDIKSELGHNPTLRTYWSSMLVCWYKYIIDKFVGSSEFPARLHVPYITIAGICGDKIDKCQNPTSSVKPATSSNCDNRTTKILSITHPYILDDDLALRVDDVTYYFKQAKAIRMQEKRGRKRARREHVPEPEEKELDLKEFREELGRVMTSITMKRRKIDHSTYTQNETPEPPNNPTAPTRTITLESVDADLIPKKSAWTPIDPLSVSHGVGLFHGQVPILDLPPELDDFKLARFLVPAPESAQQEVNFEPCEALFTSTTIEQISSEISIY